ncbi:Gfo/Idh/MocA family oxidoreductase, partial [bacterium]|nr:Gfo/Idh/MocA family oxidoreductase [bacterium]
MKRTCQITRRGFLQTAAALATPAIVASSVLGKDGATAPSEKVVMGAIGVGGMGTGNMRNFLGKKEVQFVAVCDVDTGHRNRAKSMVDGKNGNTDCKDYNDFRAMLADKLDLTAICLALPDHWHAIPVIAAARQGIDMYGEKPLARSIREGRAMVDAVHRYGRVWQTGSWQRSGRDFHHAASLVRNGRIGKITHVEVGLPTGRSTGPRETEAAPGGLDWNMWLGPAPWRPYCKFGGRGVHFDWRWNMDYSGGQLTDWAGHHIDIAHW